VSKTPTAEEVRRRAAAAGNAGWEPFTPLVSTGRLPAFPADALPPWGKVMVEAVAEETQTPPDLPGVLFLGVLATAAGGRAEVEVQAGWTEPLNLYAVPALDPGSRKSAVVREMTRPILDAEEALRVTVGASIAESSVDLEIAQEAAKIARQAAARCGTDDAKADAIAKAQLIGSITVPAWPRLIADDVTAEALTSLLAEQGGRIAVLSAEGDLFDIMCGRYTRDGQVPNLGIFLKGHAGDLLLVDRKGREPERIDHPALTIVVTIQPQVLLDIARRPVLRGRGLLARVLYSLPPDLVGHRRVEVTSVPAEDRAAYRANATALILSLADWTDPAKLLMTEQARKLLGEFQVEIEPRLRKDTGDLAELRDWASKLAGATVRLAGLLHLGEHLGDGWGKSIESGTMERAIQLGRYFTDHARAAFRQMGADPQIADAQALLAWVTRTRAAEFSRRDAFRGVQSARFQKVTDLDEPIALLVEHGYIRPAALAPTDSRAGRPPGPSYQVHPELSRDWA
jgi:replicative DNA helicase